MYIRRLGRLHLVKELYNQRIDLFDFLCMYTEHSHNGKQRSNYQPKGSRQKCSTPGPASGKDGPVVVGAIERWRGQRHIAHALLIDSATVGDAGCWRACMAR